MLKNNKYYYQDDYMYFTFKQIHSSKYNLFIVNEDEELRISHEVEQNTEYLKPNYQNSAFLLGSNKSQKIFNLKVAAEGLTLLSYKELLHWLNSGDIGFLYFDYNPFWGWNTVLEDINEESVNMNSNGIIVELSLKFATIDSYLANSIFNAHRNISLDIQDFNSWIIEDNNEIPSKTELEQTSVNEFGIPEIVYTKEENEELRPIKKVWIQNITNYPFYINYSFSSADNINNNFNIIYNNKKYIDYKLNLTPNSPIEFLGKFNFVLKNNVPIELDNDFISGNQENGLLKLNSVAPQLMKNNITKDNNNYVIPLAQENIDFIITNSEKDFFIAIVAEDNSLQNQNFNNLNLDNSRIQNLYYNAISIFNWNNINFDNNSININLTEESRVVDVIDNKAYINGIEAKIYLGVSTGIIIEDCNSNSSILTVIKSNIL